jgi:hypothetical protein
MMPYNALLTGRQSGGYFVQKFAEQMHKRSAAKNCQVERLVMRGGKNPVTHTLGQLAWPLSLNKELRQ